MSKILFLDIETLQTEDEAIKKIVADGIKAPSNYKNEDTIKKYIAEQAEKAISKTSFNGLYGSICCIGFAVGDGEIHSVQRESNEKELLKNFFSLVNKLMGKSNYPIWCGHNVTDFDLPFLYQRCLVNNVKPTVMLPKHPKAWSKDIFDTLYEVTGKNVTGGSLDAISKILGVGKKTEGMDGGKVYQAWLDGRIDEIASYCRDDVYLTRELYKRINFIETVEDLQNAA